MSKADKAADEAAETVGKPTETLQDADAKTEVLGRVAPEDVAGVDNRGQAPVHGSIAGADGPSVVASGTPAAQLRPDLPQMSDGSARGETQPGIPQPGEAERAVDVDKANELSEKSEGKKHDAIAVRNGMIHVGNRAVIPVSNCTITYDGEGDEAKATIVPLGGEAIVVEGPSADKLRAAMKKI